MSLEDLNEDVQESYSAFGDELSVSLDRETKNELALLETALEPEETDELVRRAVHMLFQTTVETGTLDFHLRSGFDVTYDEYLSGMTFDEMTGGDQYPSMDDERRYQF
ncbi:hypothetical protein [Natronobacterium gregoryi]|uniref:Uncharacterized protein n=2 Tax=Natronobacterium gregoryi TaxID=44930 RepID=L0AEP0_NATGS|nr:hypothetical protein [Natronobacterium gregoryi]AFZ71587.1 hypothetical protein Natgr_0329 [Natronobacterium gregoryi SP2]ELY66642.1 hypothetical protein C490_12757 [Natronobacterium gregoryi SP2]PLK21354.1 hypothetical protein CYV19_04770 [Natronobacterium gregoryi SP2]SFI81121.1 hypothetical protein SAMN05443661_10656 [Natronobacterium gregoryi]